MRNKIVLALSIIGIIGGVVSAYLYGVEHKPQPPAFAPASNPYAKGVYSIGIIESDQSNGENINIFPEVSGIVTRITAAEGQTVRKGAPLFVLDDSVQKAIAEQQKSQAAAALALLEQLKAQPRKETLEIAKAQVDLARANLKTAQDQLAKQRRSYELYPKSVSQDALDNAENAFNAAKANLEVVQRQYDLTRAGAWVYDIRNQESQYNAFASAAASSGALLAKYTVRAPADGVVLSINAAVGSFVSPQGTYATYTQGFKPVAVMGVPQDHMGVRCYVDEILIHRLPPAQEMKAEMFVRGTDIRLPLQYVRVQPYVSPKVELSNQRTERVDVRVLPVIFRFEKPKDAYLYPGQLVDVYIGGK
jgi:HlyD family secretion protein